MTAIFPNPWRESRDWTWDEKHAHDALQGALVSLKNAEASLEHAGYLSPKIDLSKAVQLIEDIRPEVNEAIRRLEE